MLLNGMNWVRKGPPGGVAPVGYVRIPQLTVRVVAHSRSVEPRRADLGEVTRAHSGTWDARAERGHGPLARALVIAEEEDPVFLDRTADGRAELIPTHGRYANTGHVVEELVGVELFVPHELIEASVQVVGARARDDVHHGGAAEAD